MDSSQIDYFLMSPSAADLVANPPTILCHDLNTSDHNPVTITIKIPALPSCSPKTVASTRIVWNNMDKSRYQEVLVSQLAATPISIASVADVWIAISSISTILHDSALKTSSPVKNRSKSNSLWTPTIKAAVSANRLAHFTWKMAGKPSDPLDPTRAKLRDTNKQLRKAQRQELAVRRDRDLGKVMSARSHDRNLMYRLIKRLKLSSREETDVLEVNGTTYTGPDQVRLGWLEHYRYKYRYKYADILDNNCSIDRQRCVLHSYLLYTPNQPHWTESTYSRVPTPSRYSEYLLRVPTPSTHSITGANKWCSRTYAINTNTLGF